MLTPQDAIAALIANNWTQLTIAEAVESNQATISNVARGAQPRYALGVKLMNLGHKYGKKLAKPKK